MAVHPQAAGTWAPLRVMDVRLPEIVARPLAGNKHCRRNSLTKAVLRSWTRALNVLAWRTSWVKHSCHSRNGVEAATVHHWHPGP
ncbi:hypothetical protein MVI01_58760 [Myxococcus virescens]|uniref:Uncharacterized protein n=1 Tax=Myxococcus virescens TaxID=83456 RepID=A0A511HKK0_9BACT|nr:hypothetical protein MVI01_58760 [Myxococcus virescens]